MTSGQAMVSTPPKERRSPSKWRTHYQDARGQMVHMVDRPLEVTFSEADRLFGVSRRTLHRAAKLPATHPARLRTFPRRPSVTRTDWLHQWMFGTTHNPNSGIEGVHH